MDLSEISSKSIDILNIASSQESMGIIKGGLIAVLKILVSIQEKFIGILKWLIEFMG